MTTAPLDAQFDIPPGWGDPHDGWLPRYGSAGMRTYVERVLGAERTALAPSVQALATYIEDNDVVRRLANNACAECLAIVDAHSPGISDVDTLLHGFNTILTHAPGFIDGELIGLPFSALMADIGRTASGAALFRQPTVDLLMSNILNDWHAFLDSPASNVGLCVDGEQWLSAAAKERYRFSLWSKDAGTPPHWKSWNAFLTRPFEHPAHARPVADPDSNRTVACPTDGAPVRGDVFRFGSRHCTLADLLATRVPRQQALVDYYRLVELFDGGRVFQTNLGPYDFQRWWAPVHGEVLFDPFTIPGCFARGVIVIRTADHGHVCCIPLGMSAASSIVFDPAMRHGARVHKGQEMGMFNGGGASFALFFEKLPGKELVFLNADDERCSPHSLSIGAQIGAWYVRK
ncbi:phophatidylserine decarboxylase associated domain-containing protein [Massilia sp. CFBP9012]|uniref:phophatidylserine decarboxylase associated domain-containing protein n=1 Tax=Massilia sp. CFBP9012 TaxID=3096531 RepID=UPI002A69FED3|nr:phophatidylserine decarboxylase associated domain-containing protein [Massilia sp. CFBP9012]MDY0976427.1 phophatidylserine decarboxylase associated domain-containing protein [Massilia sp. CFBP9012]